VGDHRTPSTIVVHAAFREVALRKEACIEKEFERGISKKDQARSNVDRSAFERDEARADSDQRASQRDQTASDTDRSRHASTDAKFMEAFAAIQAERGRATAERDAAAEDREIAAADRAIAARDRHQGKADREQARMELEQARIDLQHAQLDELTGFYRIGLGTAVLQREIDRNRRLGGSLTLAYCDVDGLKRVNDEQGHAAGDALLAGLAEAMRRRLRPYDPVVRVGGDEFVCALSEVDSGQASRIFHDIQANLAGAIEGATVSFGLAELLPDDDLGTLLERSDFALREARSESADARR
jgi:diguanylate cyclase (GGDEF)-like protein